MKGITKQIVRRLTKMNERDAREFYEEFYTKTERAMFAKRLAVIAMLVRGVTQHEIARTIGVSPASVQKYANLYNEDELDAVEAWLVSTGVKPIERKKWRAYSNQERDDALIRFMFSPTSGAVNSFFRSRGH